MAGIVVKKCLHASCMTSCKTLDLRKYEYLRQIGSSCNPAPNLDKKLITDLDYNLDIKQLLLKSPLRFCMIPLLFFNYFV